MATTTVSVKNGSKRYPEKCSAFSQLVYACILVLGGLFQYQEDEWEIESSSSQLAVSPQSLDEPCSCICVG
jgi:hypothetical protein